MLWVFGYGSLAFRPGFEYARRELASVCGYARRFYQGSTDHRGVPGAPGRVLTLVPSPGERCWGIAFGVEEEHAAGVLDFLDVREQGGYVRWALTLSDRTGARLTEHAVTYVATPENPHWLGAASIDEMARQIQLAAGPSGRNADYVTGIARVLADMGIDDEHVFDLAERVLPGWQTSVLSTHEPERRSTPRRCG